MTDLLNLSAVNASGTAEGLILPQANDVSAATAEGQITWDTDDDALYVGDGIGVVAVGTGDFLRDGSRSMTGNLDVGDNNIVNVGDIALDTISSDAGTTVAVSLGTDAGDDFIVGNNNALVVEGDNDRVGIGTTTPGEKLDVDGNIRGNQFQVKGYILGYNYGGEMQFNQNDITFQAGGNDDIIFKSGGVTELVRFEAGGNVGIGTTTPLAKLAINGGLHVGGDSDPGDNNLLVDGNLEVDGTLDVPRVSIPNGDIRFGQNTANDGTYEWVGWYSGASRAGIFLWDGDWSGCNAGKFCMLGDTHQLMLRSNTGNVLVSDNLDATGNLTASGNIIGGGGATPSGAVMFFNLGSCPAGWTDKTSTWGGLYIVAKPSGGTLAGTALSNQENRATGQHLHTMNTRVGGTSHTPGPPVTDNWGNWQTWDTLNAGSVAGTNAPYVQLLVCQKN